MKNLVLLVLCAGLLLFARSHAQPLGIDRYLPLTAAPDNHQALFENEYVLVLDVSIAPGATVPTHLHPWPAVFITLEGAHLIFRNVDGVIVRESKPQLEPASYPIAEWRLPDTQPASVTNVSENTQRALRIEMKFLGP
ncbi:MAG: hypothetical protein HC809_03015 [Gammaproteobacteria bacterium]|nr:hypothetical protein [Gammaproteobacteria bacterium]